MARRQRPANPVIEQAMSIMMAELTCTPDEAFDLLRRASQRANIKVSVLAAHLIDQAPGWSQVGA
jgi:AmiR/NasT family two-component response regulator